VQITADNWPSLQQPGENSAAPVFQSASEQVPFRREARLTAYGSPNHAS
jgi:hypothetical protein